jgi:hypothetical protein
MKAVGVIGPDFEPRLFDVDEPIPARDGVVVEVMRPPSMSSTGPRLVGTTSAKRIGWLPCCWGETS